MAKMNGVAVALSEAEQIEAEVDRLMEEEVEKRRAALRLEVIGRMQREAFERKMAWINRPRPDLDLTPEQIAERHRLADESLARQAAKLAANDARFAEGEKARVEAEKRMPRMRVPGSEGLTRR